MGNRNYSSQGSGNGGHGVSRLKSQLSFTRQDSLSQISEVSENLVDGVSSNSNQQNPAHSFAAAGFGMDSWDNTNSIASVRSLFQFSLPQTTLEMATVEKLLHIPEDSVPCKIRAKRGCATHPRSIAERMYRFIRPTYSLLNSQFCLITFFRAIPYSLYDADEFITSMNPILHYFKHSFLERRTRISGKLKKLQELVPNMDKQTSYADMLDLAVQHIKGLQNEVQKLHKELESCTCGCNQSS
ncbi:hypothetical protein GOBAR_DD24227 [Gossypium barbadense]|nr:hypothetical protein GOBAR_DD24227 [Gossypium barbadense]